MTRTPPPTSETDAMCDPNTDDLIPRFRRWLCNTGYDAGDANSPPKRLLAAYKALLSDRTALIARVEELEAGRCGSAAALPPSGVRQPLLAQAKPAAANAKGD